MPSQLHVIIVADALLGDLLVQECQLLGLSGTRFDTLAQAVRASDERQVDLAIVDPRAGSKDSFLEDVQRLSETVPTLVLVSSGPERAELPGSSVAVRLERGLDALLQAAESVLGVQLRQRLTDERTHVLIVDDTADIRELLSDFLSDKNYRISMAVNGRDALDAVEGGGEFDLVLLDLQMPKVGGMETLRQIRRMKPEANVIMMTAVADKDIARMALDAGAFDYIVKPLNLATVESSITACLSHAAYKRNKWWKLFGS